MKRKSRLKTGRPTAFERQLSAATKAVHATKDLSYLHSLLDVAPTIADKGKAYAQIAIQQAIFQDAPAAWEYMRLARGCWVDNYPELSHGLFIASLIRKILNDPLHWKRLQDEFGG